MGEDGLGQGLNVVGQHVVALASAASALAAFSSMSPARGLAPSSVRGSSRVA